MYKKSHVNERGFFVYLIFILKKLDIVQLPSFVKTTERRDGRCSNYSKEVRYLSASSAAMHPNPAETIAWR